MNPSEIDLAVMCLGFMALFAIGAMAMYSALVSLYAIKHYERGYSLRDAVRKAVGELV